MTRRDHLGRFGPGGGSPNRGGQSQQRREVIKLAQDQGAESIAKLVSLRDGAEDEKIQMQCASILLDRGFGRPIAPKELNVDGVVKHELQLGGPGGHDLRAEVGVRLGRVRAHGRWFYR